MVARNESERLAETMDRRQQLDTNRVDPDNFASRVSAIMRETEPVPQPTSNTRDPNGTR